MGEITDPDALAQLNATGGDFLKTLDPSRASMVRALAEGRQALPAGYSMRSPLGQQLLADVAQYDPTFDAANLPARVATRKAFTSGKQAQNVTSFNTALGHLGTLAQRAEELDNGSFPVWNTIANAAESATGDPRASNFGIARKAVADELTRAFRGSGGNVADIKEWEENINSAQSPAQLRGAIQQAADLLNSRVLALKDSYNAGMGTTDQPLPMLNQHAADAMHAFGSKDYLDKGYQAVAGAMPPSDGGNGGGNPPPAAPLPGQTPPSGPIDPSGQGDIGFVNGGQPKSPFSSEQQAAYDAFMKANPKASAEQVRAFGSSLGLNLANADDIVKARDAGSGVASADTAVYDTSHADHPGALGSAVLSGANALTFGALPKLGAVATSAAGKLEGDGRSFSDLYSANLAANNATVGNAESEHPYASLGGAALGALGGLGALRAAPGAAALIARTGSLAPVAEDAAYGLATGLGSSDSLSDAPGSALKGVGLSIAGGAAGRGTGAALGRLVAPTGGKLAALYDAGVRPTLGQRFGDSGILGRAANAVEEAVGSIPFAGSVVRGARDDARNQFQRGAFNQALGELPDGAGGTLSLPADVETGTAAHSYTQKAFNDAYDKARSGMTFAPDAQFNAERATWQADLANGVLSGEEQDQAERIVKNALDSRLETAGGQLTGDAYKAAASQLGKAADKLGRVKPLVADAVKDFASMLDDGARRVSAQTNPEAVTLMDAADKGYAKLVRIEQASAAAGGEPGQFSPQQLRSAVQKASGGVRSKAYLRGEALMQDYADAGMALRDRLPNSGTSDREAVGRLLGGNALGAGMIAGAVAHPGAALTGLGLVPYAPGIRRASTALLAPRSNQKLRTLGDLLRNQGSAVLGSGAAGAAAYVPPLLQPNSR